jgi:hypothetical protein
MIVLTAKISKLLSINTIPSAHHLPGTLSGYLVDDNVVYGVMYFETAENIVSFRMKEMTDLVKMIPDAGIKDLVSRIWYQGFGIKYLVSSIKHPASP